MFEKKIDAEARILADEGSGSVMNTDFHGVHWSHHTYILEVRPPAGETFRCPGCGARVDQSVASVAEHPICEFCRNPLPCQPVPEDY